MGKKRKNSLKKTAIHHFSSMGFHSRLKQCQSQLTYSCYLFLPIPTAQSLLTLHLSDWTASVQGTEEAE